MRSLNVLRACLPAETPSATPKRSVSSAVGSFPQQSIPMGALLEIRTFAQSAALCCTVATGCCRVCVSRTRSVVAVKGRARGSRRSRRVLALGNHGKVFLCLSLQDLLARADETFELLPVQLVCDAALARLDGCRARRVRHQSQLAEELAGLGVLEHLHGGGRGRGGGEGGGE